MAPSPPAPATPSLRDRLEKRLDRLTTTLRDAAAGHPNSVRAIAALGACVVIVAAWFLYQVVSGLPGRDELRELGASAEGTTVYDAYDRPIFSFPTRYHIETPLSSISPHLRRAIVAVEDVRFYEHDGIDTVRLIGAILTDIRERRAAEGASTITQQLARVSFLTPEKTLRRKLREAIVAQRLERLYAKDEILELYLNKVYFGDGLYGAEAASRGYFGKPAAALTIAEAALLAGVVKAPSSGNPVANLQRAVERRNVVLRLMREHNLVGEQDYASAVNEPVTLRDNLRRDDGLGIHFKEIIRRELVERFGKEAVYEGRLKVYTSIDPDLQKAAEVALTESLARIESRIKRVEEPLQGALIALDVTTGEVRAIVGGRDTRSVGLNRALQTKRQPGSAFKPFIYAAALEHGYSPASVIDGLNTPVETLQGAWLPEDEHSDASSMTMRAALRSSSNRAAVRVLENVGTGTAVSYARQLGVGTVPNVPSLALGSGEVTLASMTAAYAAFAQGGIVRDPVFIRRVEDSDGTRLFEGDARPRRAVSETTAFLMSSMLADVIDTGTANRARRIGFSLPAAGKTGTTNDFVDAWFVGYTPKIVSGVWVGFDRPRTIVKNGFAAHLAVPMWAAFMKAATRNDPKTWFAPPRNVVAVDVCRVSGMLPSPGCSNAASVGRNGEVSYRSMVYTDYFVRGTEPQTTCSVHAAGYFPYPEPFFAVSALDDLKDALVVPSNLSHPELMPSATVPLQSAPEVLPVPTAGEAQPPAQ